MVCQNFLKKFLGLKKDQDRHRSHDSLVDQNIEDNKEDSLSTIHSILKSQQQQQKVFFFNFIQLNLTLR